LAASFIRLPRIRWIPIVRPPELAKHGRAHEGGVGWAAVVQAARSLENATRWINEPFDEAFHDIRRD
jgi:hypothetical protein